MQIFIIFIVLIALGGFPLLFHPFSFVFLSDILLCFHAADAWCEPIMLVISPYSYAGYCCFFFPSFLANSIFGHSSFQVGNLSSSCVSRLFKQKRVQSEAQESFEWFVIDLPIANSISGLETVHPHYILTNHIDIINLSYEGFCSNSWLWDVLMWFFVGCIEIKRFFFVAFNLAYNWTA